MLMMEIAQLIALTVAVLVQEISGDILVYPQFANQIVAQFHDMPAHFGPSFSSPGLRAVAVNATPANACTDLTPPPAVLNDSHPTKYVVLVARYNCSFEDKIKNAQKANFDAVIVYNLGSDELEQMSVKDPDEIFIPAMFVGENTGKIILYNYLNQDGFVLVLNDDLPFNINTHLILPFAIVVGLCFVIMIGFMVVKCIREQRRLRRRRLPSSVLRKIPTIKFTKHDNYETCAICLDDYIEGERLRVLPCNHAYHTKCIDPWLTKNRRVCPICKRKVFGRGERRRPRRQRSSSDSMSSSDVDDTTPLLNPVGNATHGTFARTRSEGPPPRVNPFDRVPPPQVVFNEAAGPPWGFLLRLFRRRQSLPDNVSHNPAAPGENQMERGERRMAIPTRSASSNNIMNANLSGSLRSEDDDSDDFSLVRAARMAQLAGAAPVERIGVAALPNTNFPAQQQRTRRQRSRQVPPRPNRSDDFIV
ncbi:E3 ubiquitin-protein ligase Godzilla-like [Phlebotomus argentipes]|uniref:E3 ubiquitin-protein ligase Godzilla-like n=1 Tax=Phlebotomus argentipes TaxID=94469 RepID=UPI002892B30E|nr:E3 ubiquitin-protein ligase Godzilla-like [Phlebotomus argentipes]XP_059612116.1 E3 ubiquitin-protein ligase Godzilla-like [Phlebotomus argentipes]XP_059612117.1 E3 ubiquitin-protein ligase Godzilla-like [Phlebotomus argentipes]XP_059612118.1 E3 ubiquitin-protein ligase Godzilla-like [Phlebotomus argentipes]XP_059612120.1 E3 ubiquitin-protein ligase Godzilla-like [Phlebotomus argentipes]